MRETVLKISYPKGTLPVRGFVCLNCGYEVLSFEDAEEASETAEKLGLLEPETVLTGEITESEEQVVLHIPKDIERRFELKKGKKVKIYTKGEEIILMPV